MLPAVQIFNVDLTAEGGLSIAYARPDRDIRKNGLMWHHQVLVPHGSDYEDEIETFLEALGALLADVLDDEDRAEPIDPPTTENEDEDDD